MAATIQPPRAKGTKRQPMSEINITPFVDVMLVLLIIFMVTAPLLVVGVPVDLPKTGARALPQDEKPLAVSITADGKLFLQDTELPEGALIGRIEAIAENNKELRIYVRADQTVSYGQVMQVMGALNNAGFSHVALVTAPLKKQ
jgi:biopolymer transport protein TolR